MHFTHSCLLPFGKIVSGNIWDLSLVFMHTKIVHTFKAQVFLEHSEFKILDHWNIFYFVMFNKKVTLPPTHFALKYYPAILHLLGIGVWRNILAKTTKRIFQQNYFIMRF